MCRHVYNFKVKKYYDEEQDCRVEKRIQFCIFCENKDYKTFLENRRQLMFQLIKEVYLKLWIIIEFYIFILIVGNYLIKHVKKNRKLT